MKKVKKDKIFTVEYTLDSVSSTFPLLKEVRANSELEALIEFKKSNEKYDMDTTIVSIKQL